MNLKELLESLKGDGLSVLTAEQLNDILAQLRQGFAELKEIAESDDDVANLKIVAETVASVKGRIVELKEAEAQREGAIAELDKLVGEDEGQEAPAEEAPAEEAPAEEAPAEEAEEKVLIQASSRLESISVKRPSEATFVPSAVGGESPAPVVASPIRAIYNPAGIVSPGEVYTADTLGRTIETTMNVMRASAGIEGGSEHTLGKMSEPVRPGELVLQASDDISDADGIVDRAIQRNLDATYQAYSKVLQASGGVCAPAETDYTIRVIGDTQGCVSNTIPTIRTSRPVRIFEDIVLDFTSILTDPRFAAGIGLVTASQDAAGYVSSNPPGPTPDKGCVHIDCPVPVDCPEMRAIYACFTMGEFQSRNFPEYARAFREMMDMVYSFKKEQTILDDIVAAAGVPISLSPAVFGSIRDILPAIRAIIARADISSGVRGNWRVYVPKHLKVQIANDILRTAFGLTNSDPLPMSISRGLALLGVDEGIMVSEYCASAGLTTQGDPTFVAPPVKGAPLAPLPGSARIIIAREGFAVRQSQGELRVGLRETLVKTNDFGMFVEGFETTCFRNTKNLYLLDIEHCDNGVSGGTVVATC
jgi:hypothetical protein